MSSRLPPGVPLKNGLPFWPCVWYPSGALDARPGSSPDPKDPPRQQWAAGSSVETPPLRTLCQVREVQRGSAGLWMVPVHCVQCGKCCQLNGPAQTCDRLPALLPHPRPHVSFPLQNHHQAAKAVPWKGYLQLEGGHLGPAVTVLSRVVDRVCLAPCVVRELCASCACVPGCVFVRSCRLCVGTTEQLVRLQRRIKEFMLNKNKDLQLAKHRTKQNFYRHQSSMRKDEAEDLDDYAGIAYVHCVCGCA